MAISLDKALGIHQHALEGRVKRAEVLANNLANADTPGYKARDVDFQAMMQKAQDSMSGFGMTRTHESHMDTSPMGEDSELLYRVPHQPSVDGNTVDASFQFLDGKVSGIKKALSGQ